MKIEDVKIGAKVRMVNCYEECCETIVVRLKDKRGGFDISCLKLVHDEKLNG